MEHALSSFSANLADLVERAGQFAVGIEARHRMGSSGFLWKPGVIVTAGHTIRREEEIPVILPGGKRATAELAGRDPDTDIAVLRVGGAGVDGADAPALSNSKALRSGEIVIAVGRHEPGVLTAMGIVSTAGGPWRTWRGGQLDALLRLDIGAYPRSSGSLVVDTQGGFAGMLTAGLTRTAPVAIPASTIDRIAAELLEHGKVAQGYLGIGLQTVALPVAFARLLKREQRAGVIVLSVEPEGPAESSGILVGDIIVEIDGHPVADTDDIHTALRGAIGKSLPAIVLRGGERVELKLKVGERKN